MKHILSGRDEPIIDPDLPIIDAHHHLFIRPGVRYLLDEFVADVTAGHRIVSSVYIETLAYSRPYGPELLRPVGEVEFANGMAAMAASGQFGAARLCAAIIGYADMRLGDQVAGLLDRCLETAPDRYRGVRQITLEHERDEPFAFIPVRPPVGVLQSNAFLDAFFHLQERRLIFDAAVFDTQLDDVARIADRFPDTLITLNHAGMAMGMGLNADARTELWQRWGRSMRELARRPNVYCKVGGFGLPFWGLGLENRDVAPGHLELAELWRPLFDTAIETFGPSRCMAESNYPPDGRSCGYVPIWNALKQLASGLSPDEKAQLFWRTAAKVHRIELPEDLTTERSSSAA